MIAKQLDKLTADIAQSTEQTAMLIQQKANAILEGALVIKQTLKLDSDIALTTKQLAKLDADIDMMLKQADKLLADMVLMGLQGNKLVADTAMVAQQTLNATTERDVLLSQICKLQAEYDVLMQSKAKTLAENELLTQKVLTERAQISSVGVDENSITGKQVKLYGAQADGFKRDAEQKAAKIMVDTWNVRRTTDEGTPFDGNNKLADVYIGQAVQKLLTGVGS